MNTTFATNWEYRFFRTKNGAEIDLILDGDFGVLPIEIKYGLKRYKRKLSALRGFLDRHNLPLGILINNADRIELIAPKIVQIPVHFL